MGIKFITKPQVRDLRQYINRSSFRNTCTTFCIAEVTHKDVEEWLIMNMDPTTIVFGYTDTTFCASVVPIGS